MKKYELILINEKEKLYNRLATLLFILNAVIIIYFLYSRYDKIIKNSNPYFGIILFILTAVGFIFKFLKKEKGPVFLFSAIVVSLYWILIGYWWMSMTMTILFYLYSLSKRKLNVSFSDRIIYPSVPERIIEWDQLNNVILKDGLLTIDFKNNKIIQQDAIVPDEINEKEFNEFCIEQLKS